MSVFTIDYELPEHQRHRLWATTNWGSGDKPRLYLIDGIRYTNHGPRGSSWRWLGYPCRADGNGLKGARRIEVHGGGRPDQALRVQVLLDLRADLNRFDLELAKP